MNQTEQVIDYMERHGSITPKEALEALGCMRLGARIFELKAIGYTFGRTLETRENRFGVPCRYARYFILSKPDKCA